MHLQERMNAEFIADPNDTPFRVPVEPDSRSSSLKIIK